MRNSVRAVAVAGVLLFAWVGPAAGEIAVFADGRILKVDDAFVEGDRIVLLLDGGGRMIVPAVRIERVVADEIEEAPGDPLLGLDCAAGWADDPLADGTPFRRSIEAAARAADLNPRLLAALVRAESAFNSDAVSRVGASGLAQLMPGTAADHGVSNVFDPDENLRGGADHLQLLLGRFESLPLALAAYNAGAATVDRYGGVPPYRETRNYVRRITSEFCGKTPK